MGVNHAYDAFLRRDGRGGRLGVFWHTQGSGKSFSMIFYGGLATMSRNTTSVSR
ncbi:hypothetical protein [uncultured Thiodictyon sp.]|uniref:hypothetical protein n=1 Tax=uncultured Thiodictyon sp. TaxID=1846217 RepID=UPI0034548D00